jgi:hypothetical protein
MQIHCNFNVNYYGKNNNNLTRTEMGVPPKSIAQVRAHSGGCQCEVHLEEPPAMLLSDPSTTSSVALGLLLP